LLQEGTVRKCAARGLYWFGAVFADDGMLASRLHKYAARQSND
jgi:hypothetical protein